MLKSLEERRATIDNLRDESTAAALGAESRTSASSAATGQLRQTPPSVHSQKEKEEDKESSADPGAFPSPVPLPSEVHPRRGVPVSSEGMRRCWVALPRSWDDDHQRHSSI